MDSKINYHTDSNGIRRYHDITFLTKINGHDVIAEDTGTGFYLQKIDGKEVKWLRPFKTTQELVISLERSLK